MNTEPQIRQRRRGVRVMLTVPVTVASAGKEPIVIREKTHTVNVSGYGALLPLSSRPEPEMFLEVTNGHTGQWRLFRVVHVGQKSGDGKYETGVESISPLEEFWGIKFPAMAEKV